METAQKTLIFILIVAIIVVGVVIFYSGNSQYSQNAITQNERNSKSDISNPTPIKPAIDLANLLSDLKGYSSLENSKKSAVYEQIKASAVYSKTLSINDCKSEPQIMRVVANSPFTVKNNDARERIISHEQAFKISVSPKGETVANINFKDEGSYGYLCDGVLSGILFVTK
jgi:hypothetical protein